MGLVVIRNGEEIGQILDYSVDIAYGEDENDYELETTEKMLNLGDMWIIEGTEYGGIVDEVSGKTTLPTLKFKGRSLQGILETFNASQLKNSSVFSVFPELIVVKGTAEDIVNDILEQLQIPFSVVGISENVYETVERFQGLYSFMRTVFEKSDLKIKCYYENGFVLAVENAIDFGGDQFVDSSIFSTELRQSAYIPNHFIGVNRAKDKIYIKDFYTDEKHNFDGFYYLDMNHNAPVYDEEYERFNSEQKIFGKDEIVEIVEDNSVITSFDIVTKKGLNPYGVPYGNTEFKNGVPYDWNYAYTQYYYETEDEEGNLVYKNFEEQEEFVPYTPVLPYWETHWAEYYKYENNNYIQLTSADLDPPTIRHELAPTPSKTEWEKSFSQYFTMRIVDNVPTYYPVEGEPTYEFHKQTVKPFDWDSNKGEYYIHWQRYAWTVSAQIKKNGKWKNVGTPSTITDSLKNGSPDGVHTFAYYFDSNKTTAQHKVINGTRWTVSGKKTILNDKVTLSYYCEQTYKILSAIPFQKGKYFLRVEVGKHAPKWQDGTYYLERKETTGYPSLSGTYYEKGNFFPEPYTQGQVFKKVEDHYAGMILKIQNKLAEYLSNVQEIKATFTPEEGDYDIGDTIAGQHPLTGDILRCKIQKKIVKIEPMKTEISYSVR